MPSQAQDSVFAFAFLHLHGSAPHSSVKVPCFPSSGKHCFPLVLFVTRWSYPKRIWWYQSSYWAMRRVSFNHISVRLCTVDCNTSSAMVQPIFPSPWSLPFLSTPTQDAYKRAVGDGVQNLAKVKVNDTDCFPSVCRARHFIMEGNQD